jgi:predicted esterase
MAKRARLRFVFVAFGVLSAVASADGEPNATPPAPTLAAHRERSSRPAEMNSAGPHPQVLGPQPQNENASSVRASFTPPDYTLVDAASERPVRVLRAAAPSQRVIVYLHGYCGDVNAPGAFAPAAAAHGTLIALLGDLPCKDKPGRFKWSSDIRGLDQRILLAIKRVNRELSLELDASDITLFGYSQGAVRAESLVRFYGKHYPRVILGGPPRRPKPEHFANAQAVAVFGGEKEDTRDMLGGAQELIARGKHAYFFLLRGVDHGDFGGDEAGTRDLGQILNFVDPAEKPAENPAIASAVTAETK